MTTLVGEDPHRSLCEEECRAREALETDVFVA